MLNDVKEENTFWLKGGRPIKNIAELGRELRQMDAETFSYHVNDEKNDFANWIQNCAQDEKLSTLARMTRDRERMSAIVERRIQELTRPPIKTVKKTIQTIHEPTIIRTRNVTLMHLTHKLPEAAVIPKTTEHTHEIYVHEVNKSHHSAALLVSHLVLGIVIGVAFAALAIALNT